ncbi:MAG TPA: DUF4255 domain-containing protein [Pyrinomonadaceae bacterium]|nr:DUF4255 domain-containing protein [Pyrinomonadaceae bacterium]
MASYEAIAAAGQAIIGLLGDACPKPEFEGARFSLYQIKDFLSPMEEGLSLFLYRIAVNGARRNLPPTVGPDGRRYRPPLPLDLHYMLTAWGKTAEKQHLLLGWAIRMLQDVPVLHSGLLNDYAADAATFRPGETIEIILDPLNLQDMSNLATLTKLNPPLFVTYVIRMVSVESKVALEEADLVQTRAFELGKVRA